MRAGLKIGLTALLCVDAALALAGCQCNLPPGASGYPFLCSADAPCPTGESCVGETCAAATSSGGGTGGASGGGTGGGACDGFRYGRYGALTITGDGCGNFNASAPECLVTTAVPCELRFSSALVGGGVGAVNDTASLQANGAFNDATLELGTATRSGCSGSWDPATSTLTVDCGGVGAGQSCQVAMTRAAAAGH